MKLDSSIIVRGFVEEIRETESWKRLQDKTQVFDERVSREIKTRGSHSVDVAMIAENLCMKLGADEITQAKAYLVGILHDLGHIAYGHAGESVAQDYLEHYDFTQEERDRIFELRKLIFGEKYALANNDKITFEHNENSVLAYLTLCKECGYVPDENIIIGIISHSTSRYENLPPLLFQQAVRLADKIAYINYDIQDLFTSFKNKPDELSALNKMYEEKPLKDPDDNEITIKMPDGRNMTFIEFVRLSADEKINLFIMEAVRDAKVQKANPENKYRELETVLTGCNDLVVKISDFRKKIRKAVTEEDKEKLEQELKALNKKLYERSPLLYAFYEVKNRSDEYIRTGKGLSKEGKAKRTKNALSAVGNKELQNEYIFKSVITYLKTQIELNRGKSEEEIRINYEKSGVEPEIIDLYFRFLEFQQQENSITKTLPGNTNQYVFPETITLVNFVGSHSNKELTTIGKKMGLIEKYENEVKPLIQSLTTSPLLYEEKTGKLTKVGTIVKDLLVEHYGAKYRLSYGLDEEDVYPLTSDEVLENLKKEGYVFEDEQLTKEERLELFKTAEKLSENEIVKHILMVINKEKTTEEPELNDETLDRGRTL